jgi:hypothetical protein
LCDNALPTEDTALDATGHHQLTSIDWQITEAQSVVKSEIAKTEAGDREEEGLVKERRVEGRA